MTYYVNNARLRKAIHESKKTYGSYTKPEYADFDVIVDDLAQVPPELEIGKVVRVMTTIDIPKRSDGRILRGKDHEVTAFPPFRHYLKTESGFELVGKALWDGDLESGSYTPDKGKITDDLAQCMMLICERYASKPNWRGYSYNDDMISAGLIMLVKNGLLFNEQKSDNPFAYFTQIIKNEFTRVLNTEKKHRDIRDESIILAGGQASFTYELNYEYERQLEKLKSNQGK